MDIIVDTSSTPTGKNARNIKVDGTPERAVISGNGVTSLSREQLDFLENTPSESVKQLAERIRGFLHDNGRFDVEANFSPGHAVLAFTMSG